MKNKLLVKILIVVLCMATLVGCSTPEVTYYDAEYNGETVEKVLLCNNGASEYKVLLSAEADEIEDYSAKELQLFIKESTGCDLEIVNDAEFNYTASDKYISIGETALKDQKGVTVDFDTYGRDGYIIKFVDNSYLICGGGSYGSLYGVYEFLNRAIGWEPYAVDEIYYQKAVKLETEKYDISDIPAFKNRTGGYFEGREDAYATARLRTYSANFDGIFGNDNWTLQGWVHNIFKVMPHEKYQKDHPEWYQGSQLCLSNTEMREEFAKRFVEIVKNNPSVSQFAISNADNENYCTCDNCMAYNRNYDNYEGEFDEGLKPSQRDNTGRSVLQMEFTNYVARKVKEALADNPQRQKEVKVVYVAYYHSEKAPVKWNESENKYEPITADCVPEDNVAVMYACIRAGFYYELMDEVHNAKTKPILDGWASLGAQMYGYVYGNHFQRTAEWFDDFSSIQKNMQYFAEVGGGNWFFSENASGSKQSVAFQNLRQYVYSKLQWNPYLDMNELIDDFMVNYYKAGAQKMKSYFDYVRLYYDTKLHELEVDGKISGAMGSIGFEYTSAYHDYNSLLQMNDIITSAKNEVEKAGYDEFTKTKLINRIKAESLTVRYYLLENFREKMDSATYVALVESFRKDATALEIFSNVDSLCNVWLGAVEG